MSSVADKLRKRKEAARAVAVANAKSTDEHHNEALVADVLAERVLRASKKVRAHLAVIALRGDDDPDKHYSKVELVAHNQQEEDHTRALKELRAAVKEFSEFPPPAEMGQEDRLSNHERRTLQNFHAAASKCLAPDVTLAQKMRASIELDMLELKLEKELVHPTFGVYGDVPVWLPKGDTMNQRLDKVSREEMEPTRASIMDARVEENWNTMDLPEPYRVPNEESIRFSSRNWEASRAWDGDTDARNKRYEEMGTTFRESRRTKESQVDEGGAGSSEP